MDGGTAPEALYEVWHLDARAPELLGRAPDKGACRRLWRNSRHVVIAQSGHVLEVRPGAGDSQVRTLRAAVAEAFRRSTGNAPEPVHVGPAGGTGRVMPERYPTPPQSTEPVAFDEQPSPVVVVTRKTAPAPDPTPALETSAMPTTCPCGEPSAPTAQRGGRASTPEFADLCKVHRQRAATRRAAKGITAAVARAETLAVSAPTKRPATKRTAKDRAVVAPIGGLLDVVRRQRAVVDALGGLVAAEAHVALVARVGAEQLAAIVDELTGGA